MPLIAKWKKIINFRLIEWQKRKKSTWLFGYPYWLTVDPTNTCNLQCVFCPTGQRRGTRPQAVLPFKKFKKIIDTLGPYLLHIDFCNWGEPLLNKELVKMIAYAKKYNPEMKVDTNLTIDLSEQDAEALIRAGLNRINISIDGASQETYEIYRRNGNFSKAIQNMQLLAKKKKELGVTAPHLHWQFLVFRHNEHEIDKAKAMAKDAGADSIGFTGPFCSPEWVPTIEEYNNYIIRDNKVDFKAGNGFCTWLWDAMTINADGSVSPCCSVEDKKDDFGDYFSMPFFWLLWNNRHFRRARKYVRDRKKPEQGNVCVACDHIGASNHVTIALK